MVFFLLVLGFGLECPKCFHNYIKFHIKHCNLHGNVSTFSDDVSDGHKLTMNDDANDDAGRDAFDDFRDYTINIAMWDFKCHYGTVPQNSEGYLKYTPAKEVLLLLAATRLGEDI